ncbi:MAG: hypothetical protein AABX93_01415 [Nanoarchaeota archaeon]
MNQGVNGLNKRCSQVFSRCNFFPKNSKGQVTIFIIIAVFIVAVVLMTYLFFPQVLANFGVGVQNPTAFMQGCMEDQLRTMTELISNQGGSIEPEHYLLYNDEKIEYLCYTDESYSTCVMQQPLLKQHIESEIQRGIKTQADTCLDSLKTTFERRGYNVVLSDGELVVELLPQRIGVTFENDLTLTRDSSERIEKINVVLNNNLYELVSIANSILNWEARYGDTETTAYMNYYKDLKVEKNLQSDGSTIYILTDRRAGDKFQFASRSVAWPPGVDLE